MINIMIVEDNELVRKSLVKFLSEMTNIHIAAEAGGGAAAMRLLEKGTLVDVLIADWNMPELNGSELTKWVVQNFPMVKVIILTMHSKDEYKAQAKAAGAKGYLLKHDEVEELAAIIRRVANGEEVFA